LYLNDIFGSSINSLEIAMAEIRPFALLTPGMAVLVYENEIAVSFREC